VVGQQLVPGQLAELGPAAEQAEVLVLVQVLAEQRVLVLALVPVVFLAVVQVVVPAVVLAPVEQLAPAQAETQVVALQG